MKHSDCLSVFLLFALFYGVKPLNAQVSIGAKAGINVTSITTNEGYKSGGIVNAIGLHAGVMAEFGIVERFAVQPELSFIQKGFRNDTKSINWIFNEADLHLLAKYKYHLGKVIGHVEAGPTLGAVLGGYKKPDDGDKITLDLDKDYLKKWDYGITAGLGFGLKLGPGTLFVDGRYMLSLDDIFEPESTVITGKSRKVGFDYTLGYLFPL